MPQTIIVIANATVSTIVDLERRLSCSLVAAQSKNMIYIQAKFPSVPVHLSRAKAFSPRWEWCSHTVNPSPTSINLHTTPTRIYTNHPTAPTPCQSRKTHRFDWWRANLSQLYSMQKSSIQLAICICILFVLYLFFFYYYFFVVLLWCGPPPFSLKRFDGWDF